MNTIKSRLLGWQSRFLLFSGRLVLLKFVMTSLPVYALFLFKAPSGIISLIDSILSIKNWGGSEENRKISWIAWSSITLRQEYGGFGVRRLKEFNIVLLGKWCWWIEEGCGLGCSWRNMVRRQGGWRLGAGVFLDGVGETNGGWFAGRMSRKVGDGLQTFFWFDRWVGDVPLRKRFPRLFNLSSDKLITVGKMFRLGWEEGGEAWRWRRRLWAWEKDMVEECKLLLDGFILHSEVSDRWLWDSDIHDGYTVSGAY